MAKKTNQKENTKAEKNQKKGKQKEKVPHTAADTIPYVQVYQNGIIEVRPNVFSKSYRIPDVNFNTITQDGQWQIASDYAMFITSFDAGVDIQITCYNRTVDIEEFQKKVFIPMKADKLNEYREEYNDMLLDKMTGAKNNLQTEKFLTLTISADDIFEAQEQFAQYDGAVTDAMITMTKYAASPMTTMERLELLNEIYNQDSALPLTETRTIAGKEVKSFSLSNCAAQGITTKDVIAPSSFEFKNNQGKVGDRYIKSFYITNYPTMIRSTMLTDFTDISTNMLVSVYFSPMDAADSIKLVKRQSVNISSNLIDAQKRASKSGYDANLVSPDLQDAKDETTSLMVNITKDNSKMFTVSFVCTIFADTEEDLSRFEKQFKVIANKHLLTVRCMDFQQEDALASALPLGNKRLYVERLMTTHSIASLIPFDVQEMRQEHGMYYGLNAVSRNMILYNRAEDKVNPNGCILGMPGAGKSFAAKREIINVLLNTDDEVYILDPEREYTPIAEAMNGSVIKLANGASTYINPFDMNLDNADDTGDPVKVKMSFVETIIEIMIGGKFGLAPIEKSIIDRSVQAIYEPYIQHLRRAGLKQDFAKAPSLLDFYNELLCQPQQEAQLMALSLERYVKGALDVFSHQTNIDINNRFTVYDIKDIGPGLKELGLQVCLDNIWNKMIQNFSQNKRTWIYIDEFYLLMNKESSSNYIAEIWKRARKWRGVPCAITQNVEDMMSNPDARTVINNCSMVMLLGQSPMNRQVLSGIFNISPSEQKYISSAKPGMGLLRIGETMIPMDDSFPKDTTLYKIMTTKPDERM